MIAHAGTCQDPTPDSPARAMTVCLCQTRLIGIGSCCFATAVSSATMRNLAQCAPLALLTRPYLDARPAVVGMIYIFARHLDLLRPVQLPGTSHLTVQQAHDGLRHLEDSCAGRWVSFPLAISPFALV